MVIAVAALIICIARRFVNIKDIAFMMVGIVYIARNFYTCRQGGTSTCRYCSSSCSSSLVILQKQVCSGSGAPNSIKFFVWSCNEHIDELGAKPKGHTANRVSLFGLVL